MSSDGDDKRKHPRTLVSLQVSYLSRGDLTKDLVTDLSPGGLFIRTSKPLDIGTAIDLEIQLKDEEPNIRVRGLVVWLRNRGPHEGMGIRFTGLLGPTLIELVEATKKPAG